MTDTAAITHAGSPRGVSLMALQYFLYFGALGVYLPYFSLYCHQIGLDGMEIGALSGVRSLMMVLFPLFWGRVADTLSSRKTVFLICLFMSTVCWTGYLMADRFAALIAVTILYGVFFSPVISFMEAFTVDILGPNRQRYGQIRVWGTVSFIAMALIMGPVMDARPARIILMVILSCMILQYLLSLNLPRSRAPSALQRGSVGFLLRPGLICFLACGFLMLVSHAAYYGFLSIHLAGLGFGKGFIGAAWAVASVSEILVMIFFGRWFGRFRLENLLASACLAAVIRWLLLSMARSPVPILCTQVLHAVTYGLFHIASVLYIDGNSPPGSKNLGQAAYNALTYGLGLMVGYLVSGSLYDRVGGHRLFMYSGAVALAAAALAGILGRFQARPKRSGL